MTLKPTNRLIGTKSDKRGRKPRARRDLLDRRGKRSVNIVKAFDALELAIGGRDAVVHTLAATDLTDEQSYLFGLIADPRNDAKSLASICAKANYTVGGFLQLFKDAKLAKAQIDAILRLTEGIPQVAEDTVALAKIREEPCQACSGTGELEKVDDIGEVTEISCTSCGGDGKHVYLPSVERQKLALEIAGLYRSDRSAGVQIANVFNPSAPPNELGGRITQDYLKDMRMGTDRLLYPGRTAGVDTSDVVEAEVIEGSKSEVVKNLTAEPARETNAKSETETNEDVEPVPISSVSSVDQTPKAGSAPSPGSPEELFLPPAGKKAE